MRLENPYHLVVILGLAVLLIVCVGWIASLVKTLIPGSKKREEQ